MINVDWVYIICSEKFETDRYNKWSDWLKDNSINGSISFYKWGSELTQEDIDTFSVQDGTLEKLYPWRTGYPLRTSEISIGINFIKVFEDAYKNNYDKILILESDVLLHPQFIYKINETLEILQNMDFNALSIGCGMGYRIQSESGQNIIASVNQFRCADSLVFTRTAIDYFYDNLKQIKVPVDEEFTQAVQTNQISVYWLEPPITVQESQLPNQSSSTQNGNYNLRIPWE